ncbi:MAG: S8 family serine peptidase [Acidobacteriia bacterium]|nr:S8 family serine peptidase [Terriglobia bacterium]
MKAVINRLLVFLLLTGLSVAGYGQSAPSGSRFIVRAPGNDQQVASDHGLSDVASVPTQGVALMAPFDPAQSQQVFSDLQSDPRVQRAEQDFTALVAEVSNASAARLDQSTAAILDKLFDPTLVSYYGSTAAKGYVNQPATALIRLNCAQSNYGATGTGIVAIIDTGVDPNHPVLQSALVAGYDFTRNVAGIPSEMNDLPPATAAVLTSAGQAMLNQNGVAVVNQSTAAILDQSTAAILDPLTLPPAFGHGTMVAGIVHLAAPNARIMPLKVFQGDGTASLFDIIRAIYFAVDHGAKVINLSFSILSNSAEFMRALNYARLHNVVVVASVGNSGTSTIVYPAGMKNVIGVASTDNIGRLSKFSNFGAHIVDLGAPGEGVITTYPGNNYAAAWGTSFSAPFVAGGMALLKQFWSKMPMSEALEAFSNNNKFNLDSGYGALDLCDSVEYIKAELPTITISN